MKWKWEHRKELVNAHGGKRLKVRVSGSGYDHHEIDSYPTMTFGQARAELWRQAGEFDDDQLFKQGASLRLEYWDVDEDSFYGIALYTDADTIENDDDLKREIDGAKRPFDLLDSMTTYSAEEAA